MTDTSNAINNDQINQLEPKRGYLRASFRGVPFLIQSDEMSEGPPNLPDPRDDTIASLKSQMSQIERAHTVTKFELLKASVERDMAISERNMVLRAYYEMIEEFLAKDRADAATVDADCPALNAIAVMQKQGLR